MPPLTIALNKIEEYPRKGKKSGKKRKMVSKVDTLDINTKNALNTKVQGTKNNSQAS